MASYNGFNRRHNNARSKHGKPATTPISMAHYEGDSMEPIGFNFVTEDLNENAHAERHHRWINKQITSAAETSNMSWLLHVIEANMPKMNLINFSTSLHRVAKLALGANACSREWIMEHETVRALQKAVAHHVSLAEIPIAPPGKPSTPMAVSEMRCLSIICWSCATLRLREESLFDHMARISETRLAELKPFELSNMLWAFAKLSLGSKRFFDGMASSLLYRREGQFSPQCLSTLVWAFGTAKVHSPAVFTSVATEISAKAHLILPQGIANTVWAYARVQRQEAHLFHVLADTAVKNDMIWAFKAQELSNIVWAFATVGLPHPQLFNRIAEVILQRRFELPPQNVANMLWAYAKLMAEARMFLFPPLLDMAEKRLDTYKPQEVSAILWAAAKEERCLARDKLFLAVPQVFHNQLPTFTSQALACMVEAFVLADVYENDFFEAMVSESLSRIATFQPPSLCTLFRGLALRSVGWVDDSTFKLQVKTVKENVIGRLNEMQPHNIMHIQQSVELFHPSYCPTDLASWIKGDTALPSEKEALCDGQATHQLSSPLSSGSQPPPLLVASSKESQSFDRGYHKNRARAAKRYQHNVKSMGKFPEEMVDSVAGYVAPFHCGHVGLDEDGSEFAANTYEDMHWSRQTAQYETSASIFESCFDVGTIPIYDEPTDAKNNKSFVEETPEALGITDSQSIWNTMPGPLYIPFHGVNDPSDTKVWKPPPMLALGQQIDTNAWQAVCHSTFEPLSAAWTH